MKAASTPRAERLRSGHCFSSEVAARGRNGTTDDNSIAYGATSTPMTTTTQLHWQGLLHCIQPRIRLTRSFDQRSHSYLGYVLFLEGQIGDEHGEFSIAVGKAAHAKHEFRCADAVAGVSVPVEDKRLEVAEFYKTSGLRTGDRGPAKTPFKPPPFVGIPPALEVYRSRGHRRLATLTYASKCTTCIWGCKMPTEMIIDQWNPSKKRYRFETHCYGPLSCTFYKSGPTRKVPGRRGMQYEEEDWVDREETGHRGPDE